MKLIDRARLAAVLALIPLVVGGCTGATSQLGASPKPTPRATAVATPAPTPEVGIMIPLQRQRIYPGSVLTIEQALSPGSNYSRYIASYLSEGYKIYGLLTVPRGPKPASGWPVIIFNHGYIPPTQYRTTERYVAYVDAFARNGYIVFKSDYRGHGSSQGRATSGYASPDYTTDVLNALATLKDYKDADPNRIGMWGHSMGGQLTLRALVISHDIRAAVIWAGVVAPYTDLLSKWHPPVIPRASDATRFNWRQTFQEMYGTPQQNPDFWNSISPNSFVRDITAPVQLDHGTADEDVPLGFSQTLQQELKAAGKSVEFYSYPGSDHNISQGFGLAMQRSVAFFDRYLKH